MSDILDKIIQHKRKEIEERESLYPVKLLERSIYFPTKPLSLRRYVLREDKSGIIAEIKRRSPSKGVLNPFISIEKISIGYMQAGASAISVLTDKEFFDGKNDDLKTARKFNYCPILRKDFILDEYQIIESKSIGADAVLLISAILSKEKIATLTGLARSFGLEVLVEVHDANEIEMVADLDIELIGVNNRNLKSFDVSLENSMRLSPLIPEHFVKISESGINQPADITVLKEFGYQGFLIGELFMKRARPEEACQNFIEKLLEKEIKK